MTRARCLRFPEAWCAPSPRVIPNPRPRPFNLLAVFARGCRLGDLPLADALRGSVRRSLSAAPLTSVRLSERYYRIISGKDRNAPIIEEQDKRPFLRVTTIGVCTSRRRPSAQQQKQHPARASFVGPSSQPRLGQHLLSVSKRVAGI